MSRIPHKCPVCEGRGTLDSSFYEPHTKGEVDCRTCAGDGIVWSYEASSDVVWDQEPFVPVWSATTELIMSKGHITVEALADGDPNWMDAFIESANETMARITSSWDPRTPCPATNVPSEADMDALRVWVEDAHQDPLLRDILSWEDEE